MARFLKVSSSTTSISKCQGPAARDTRVSVLKAGATCRGVAGLSAYTGCSFTFGNCVVKGEEGGTNAFYNFVVFGPYLAEPAQIVDEEGLGSLKIMLACEAVPHHSLHSICEPMVLKVENVSLSKIG